MTYGIAVRGFARGGTPTLPVRIAVDVDEEPDPREGQKPVSMHATVEVRGLTTGGVYTLFRFDGFNSFPAEGVAGHASKLDFTASADEWRYRDPAGFESDGAVYYIVTEK